MGTRAYAEEVCAAIDPEGKFFGGRLLSRDESGSLTQKSLQRLFPTDQSMVVIIDDRADVWEWSPNLVKVIPYDFFVGIGDINSAFLPKLDAMTPALSSGPSALSSPDPSADSSSSSSEKSLALSPPDTPPSSPSVSSISASTTGDTVSAEAIAKNEILKQNTMALEAQVEERPLAKKQEELQEASGSTPSDAPAQGGTNGAPTENADEPKPKPVRKALLKNDDSELERIGKLLDEVHLRYFDEYDARPLDAKSTKRRIHKATNPVTYDVRIIIPRMRMDTLAGVHIVFSSVIPLDTRPEATEIWRTAHAFGAKCYTELSNRVTHVVAAKRGTQKVDAARRSGGIKIVWLSWFTDSVALWKRQDETPYLMDPDPPPQASAASPPSDPHQISSDPEPDADDWDQERAAARGDEFALDEVDWDEINNEVEAAMNESDDEGASEKSGSGNVSEDETFTDESNSAVSSTTSSPRLKRKRLRSLTPSEIGGLNGNVDSDILRSRLAKRKKIAADRTGNSKLKEAITAEDLVGGHAPREVEDEVAKPATPPRADDNDSDESDDEDDEDAPMDDEDDFLARELEEEWG
ncbi:uncharacterized protein FIBRA_05779 [Fibroporia radiculosa]|uniref:protein-serine/threonine phosphatase n=1 Tax=Fibroporia radiculosa TaxID=599839 RepID=J4GRL0_9APHY|nr:uncharacterized protein FIBRA_05779 [Fibroporia radiculosa]CCM03635.1 predicted protein [Fibroporia radiculosa]